MTTPASGGPGWNGHEQPDSGEYAPPPYEDTGWHLDLSGANEDGRRRTEPGRPDNAAFPYKTEYGGNGVPAANPGYDRRGGDNGRYPRRRAGRHARHSRPDQDWPEPPPDAPSGYQPPDARRPQPRDYQPGPEPRDPRRYLAASDPVAYRSAPPPDHGYRRYPDPLREAMYPAPPTEPRERPAPGPWDGALGQPALSDPYGPLGQPAYSDPYGPPGYPDPYGPPGRQDWNLPTDRPPRNQPTKALPRLGPDEVADADVAQGRATGTFAIVKSSSVMAVGTLASRLTGFLRTIAQSAALGAAGIATAYNLANTLPNVVYNLALGGILTSVIVPLIVNAGKRDADRGEGYDQRMFTLITLALLGITLVATAAAAPLAHLYIGSSVAKYPGAAHLTVIFAYFFIPQIFFYGVSSLIGALLNSRGSFAAPMWTPIINNFVVIGVLGLYVAVAGLHKTPTTITPGEVQLLGFGTTLGIIAQTVALIPALRRVGFHWRPRLDFRRAEAAEIGRMGGWMFAYVVATQVAFLVTTKLAGDGGISGVTDYSYAWLLFQLPYAVVGISVITALLPRMSAHASDGRLALVRQDFSTGVRLAATIVVPCSLVLAVLGPGIAVVFLAHGATQVYQAHYMGVVFAVFCLGLLPYMIFQLQLRVFYALHDSKTPALIGAATMSLNIAANLVALHVLPQRQLVAGLGVGFGLANLLGTIVAWRILSRRLGGLDGRTVSGTLVKMHAASLPATLLAVLMGLLVGGFVTGPHVAAAITMVLGGGGAFLVYLLFARALGVRELASLSRSLRSRFGR